METLKRCKRCGGEADIFQDDTGLYVVGCDRDADCENNIFMSENEFESEEEAAEWWNRRN